MHIDDFDFDLPEGRIALRPIEPRDSARMLNVIPEGPQLEDLRVTDLVDILQEGDALVYNNTKVIPARLSGRRVGRGDTEPKIEVTLHKKIDTLSWDVFAKPGKKLQVGDVIAFGDGELSAQILAKKQGGEIRLHFDVEEQTFDDNLAQVGVMPLPPYIASKRAVDDNDIQDYQTHFAEKPGAVAAPTAGLHFTDQLLSALKNKGISQHSITLHVGAGTFLPVKVENVSEHKMHSEWAELGEETAHALNEVKQNGGRIIAVGTTSLRTLESFTNDKGMLEPQSRETDIFITPGYQFRCVDILLTNFHLPKSTLFMLVSAFSGLGVMKQAYAHAIANNYRFYSYGDACLLQRA